MTTGGIMAEGSLRGTRLGATSFENDDHVVPAIVSW